MTALRTRVGTNSVYVYRNPHKRIRPWCWITTTAGQTPAAVGDAPIAHVALYDALTAAGAR